MKLNLKNFKNPDYLEVVASFYLLENALLMHERMFRKGKLNDNKEVDKADKSELKKLSDLIDYFKNIKAEFKTLDDY